MSEEGKGGEGGYAKFGNFHNYYEFNKTDERMKFIQSDLLFDPLLEKHFFQHILLDNNFNEENFISKFELELENIQAIKIIDIGCNEGEIMKSLLNLIAMKIDKKINEKTTEKEINILNDDLKNDIKYKILNYNLQMLGVDIDDELITRCHEKMSNFSFFSDIFPPTPSPTSSIYLTTPPSSPEYPFQFLNCNFVTYPLSSLPFNSNNNENNLKSSKNGFSIVFALSITMWIHINWGDEGLTKFLRNLSEICNEHLVIEPQPWKSYLSMRKRHKKLKYPIPPSFFDMKVRKNVEEFIHSSLLSFGFHFQSVCYFYFILFIINYSNYKITIIYYYYLLLF